MSDEATPSPGFAYATSDDLVAYMAPETPPASITARQLREASAQVDEMLLLAVYAVDADGMPLDEGIRATLRDATCAQALHVAEYGTPEELVVESGPVTLGPLSLGGRSGSSLPVSISPWSSAAVRHLRAAGLTAGPVR